MGLKDRVEQGPYGIGWVMVTDNYEDGESGAIKG